MSSSSEEELDELLRRQGIRQSRNFEDGFSTSKILRNFEISFVSLWWRSSTFWNKIGLRLEHRTRRNRPLTARRQLQYFFDHFLGTNSFYHLMHSCHGISTSTVWHVIHRVVPVILSFKRESIRQPNQPLSIATRFRDIAGFLCVAECVDGHVPVNPPHNDEDSCVNRHHSKSLNVAMVTGPDYTIYFCSSRCPGRLYDSRVIKESTLCTAFDRATGAQTIPRSSYSRRFRLCLQQLVDPPVEGAPHKFIRHGRKHDTLSYGVLEKRFYALQAGMRV